MILTGGEIISNARAGKIKIDPFRENHATTNSYDLKLGGEYIRYTSDVLDPKEEPEFTTDSIPAQGLTLQKGDFILASSQEKIGSDHFVPLIHAKSGIARLGLFVHVTADLIDIGSYGNVTFQLYATLPIKIYPGMTIAQVTFWVPKGEIRLYDGKYQGSEGPQPSRIYMDKS